MQPLQQQSDALGMLIAGARRRIKQAVWLRAEKFGLTAQQFWMVVGLERRGETTLSDLATRIRVDRPTASRLVSGLVRKKLLVNATDRVDRRRSQLGLTKQGHELAQRLLPIAAEIRAGIERGFSEAELETARALLRRVIDNAEKLVPAGTEETGNEAHE